jgi:glucokinase
MNEHDTGTRGGQTGVGDILQVFLDGKARTKGELVSLTGLARSTVSMRVDALLTCGLIVPAGDAVSTGGRPSARLAFNRAAGLVLAVDLGASHAMIAVADLAGDILAASTHDIDVGLGPEVVLGRILAETDLLLQEAGAEASRLFGVGIGVPGPVEHRSGRLYNPPIMPGWDQFDIPAFVRTKFDVPVLVDNDVNILALGEHATSFPDVLDLVYVKVATGIGAGIIAGGQLQRGAQGSAGDLGHVRVAEATYGSGTTHAHCDLESVAGGVAIAEALATRGVDSHTSADVVRLVREGNALAARAVRQAGRVVGEALSNIVSLLNPSVIVLGGSVSRSGEHLLAGVREVVYSQSIPLATQHLQIVQSRTGQRAAVIGAAIMVVQEVLSSSSVDELVAAGVRLPVPSVSARV